MPRISRMPRGGKRQRPKLNSEGRRDAEPRSHNQANAHDDGDFEVLPGEVPRLTNGGILCRARWLAVDPFVCVPVGARPQPGPQPGDVVPALGVCQVLESRHDVFAVGQHVVLECGMRELCVSDGQHVCALHPCQGPASRALGLLGPWYRPRPMRRARWPPGGEDQRRAGDRDRRLAREVRPGDAARALLGVCRPTR
ncbi:MAG: hypothetical protein ACREV7_05760 [Steroidobacteraceae bacterium]